MLLNIAFHWDGPQSPGKYDSNGLRLNVTMYRTQLFYQSCMAHLSQIAQQVCSEAVKWLTNPTQGAQSGQTAMNNIITDTWISSLGQKDNLVHFSTRDKPNSDSWFHRRWCPWWWVSTAIDFQGGGGGSYTFLNILLVVCVANCESCW